MDITEEDILSIFDRQNGRCYWLGVEMMPSQKIKSPFQPSLDRLDRNRGYTKDNVVLCCFVANFGRNSSSVGEFTEFLSRLEKEMSFSQWK